MSEFRKGGCDLRRHRIGSLALRRRGISMFCKVVKAAVVAGFVMVAGSAGTSASAGECKGVDASLVPSAEWVGKQAWLYEPRHRMFENDPRQWATIDTFEQTGPAKYTIVQKRLEYGQPVKIVFYKPEEQGPGVAGVELPDGSKHFVSGKAIRFFEFWKCGVDALLEKRANDPTPTRRNQYLKEVWVRISNPDAKLINSMRDWIPAEETRSIAFAICYGDNTAWVNQHKNGEKPMMCTAYGSKMKGDTNFSADAVDLETVSPTSMKILFGS